MTKNKIVCPICLGEFYAVEKFDMVCGNHQDWLVTTCPDCHVPRFDQAKGVCPSCLNASPRIVGFGFNRNRRGSLVRNGMGCKDNG